MVGLLTRIKSRNTTESTMHGSPLPDDDSLPQSSSRRQSLISDTSSPPASSKSRKSAMEMSPRIGSQAEPAMGEGSLKLEHLLIPAEDGSLLPPAVPELCVDPATPLDASQGMFAAVGMVRRLSDQSDISQDGSSSHRNRSSSFAQLGTNGQRPRSPSFRKASSAANSPAKPRAFSKSAASGGIASALAISGAALMAQGSHTAVQAAHFSAPTPTSGRPRTVSLEDDFDLDSPGVGLDDLVGPGYAVASRKRNEEFHAMFEDVGEDDYLIEDYGCALQKEILVQGRLYISEHHICFNANIFGWVTHLVIPFAEVISIKKSTTAFVIPNAIQVATMHARYSFASFLSRDTTFELLGNIWHISHPSIPSVAMPDYEAEVSEAELEDEEPGEEGLPRKRINLTAKRKGAGKKEQLGPSTAMERVGSSHSAVSDTNEPKKKRTHKVTSIPADVKQYSNVCLDEVFTSSPEKMYNLMFTSQAFMREFWATNQKLTEIQVEEWKPSADEQHMTRGCSYIKPLNGAVGPKQMKCFITDLTEIVDTDNYIVVLTSTRTPDAPSGASFVTQTKTCITWDRNNCCRVKVTTEVEWSAKSWLKGVITNSAIDGQKTYHSELAKEMKAYIHKHKSEFQHDQAGDEIDDDVVDNDEAETSQEPVVHVEIAPVRQSPFERLVELAQDMVGTTLELVQDSAAKSLEQCSKHRFITGLIMVLVMFNVWTFLLAPTRFTPGRVPADPRNSEEVARAVKGVLHEYFYDALRDSKRVPAAADDRETILRELEELEARIGKLRGSLEL